MKVDTLKVQTLFADKEKSTHWTWKTKQRMKD